MSFEWMPPEAWAVLLACGLMPLFIAAHIVLSRLGGEQSLGQQSLLLAGVAYGVAWVALSFVFWGAELRLSQSIAGLATVGFVLLAWMQVYSQIGRGFSLRILVDIDRCAGLDIEGILREYSDGRGAQWLIDKRLEGLEQVDLAHRDGGDLVLVPPNGAWAGRFGILFKRILKPEQGG